ELIGQPAKWEAENGEAPPSIIIHVSTRGAPGRPQQPPKPGDRILAKLSPTGDERYPYEARIIRKLTAQAAHLLGIFRTSPGQPARIMPVDKKSRNQLEVLPGDENGATNGELVEVSTFHDRGRGLIRAKVIKRFGSLDDQRNISMIAVHQYGIPVDFSESVLKFVDDLKPFPVKDRTDLRDVPLVTIDPPDARDHDDAVWACADDDAANEGGFQVIVAIADVAFYVRSGTELDQEARIRGNSVYLPDRVVPMLPERLSTDLCSLKEARDRPVLACFLTFDAKGRKRKHRFERAVMRSAASLSYDRAQAAIDGKPDKQAAMLLEPVLKPLWAAYAAVAKARAHRQPLELELPERKIILNEAGHIDQIVTPPRFDAHKLIEEFMIQANVAAAETLQSQGSPLLYRVHDAPSVEKVAALSQFLKTLGLSAPVGQTMKPKHFNQLLKKCRGRSDEHIVNEMILRTQAQAIYSAENAGHFGLNLRHYAHFTSPIRRYADLIVHRALISAFKLGSDGLGDRDVEKLHETAELISSTERRAMSAERETVDRLIASHLAGQVRARFQGRIGGVTRAGLFVRLEETGADGFVPASTIGTEYYVHDETKQALVGSETGETFQLGDKIEVRLLEVTPITGGLRFEILSDGKKGKPVRRERNRRSAPRRPRRSRR
ncbi:MAG: ribonuclease R, partial [Aestuariivirgaceae bacterium]